MVGIFFERMTREEAVRSLQPGRAYAAFEEKLKGSIESGKLADFIIISNDIFTCPVNAIPANTDRINNTWWKKTYIRR